MTTPRPPEFKVSTKDPVSGDITLSIAATWAVEIAASVLQPLNTTVHIDSIRLECVAKVLELAPTLAPADHFVSRFLGSGTGTIQIGADLYTLRTDEANCYVLVPKVSSKA